MQCRLGWWLVCRLSTSQSLESASVGGADFLCSPSLSLESSCRTKQTTHHWSTQRILTHSAWISIAHLLAKESAAAAKIYLLPTDPSQPTLPCHHGAITTATRWTVSCHHTFSKCGIEMLDLFFMDIYIRVYVSHLLLLHCWISLILPSN